MATKTKIPIPWTGEVDLDAESQVDVPHGVQGSAYGPNYDPHYGMDPGLWIPHKPQPNILRNNSQQTRKGPYDNEKGLSATRAGDPIPYVFGRTLMTPQIISAGVWQQRLYVDYLVSMGECEEFEYYVRGGEILEAAPADLVNMQVFYGTSGQSASSWMTSTKGEDYDTLPDVCHFVTWFIPGESFDVRMMMKGMKLYDPRTGTTVYSSNPALALARVFSDAGYTVDYDSVETLADHCDEDVEGSPRWEIGLTVANRNTLRSWAHTLAQYAGGCYIDIQGSGEVSFIPDAKVSPALPTHIVTDDDILSATTSRAGRKDVPEKVVIQYTEAEGASRTAITGSGTAGETSRLQLPGFPTYTMAKRYGEKIRRQAQTDLMHEHVGTDAGIVPTIGDLGTVTFGQHNIYSRLMRLVENTALSQGRWRRKYIEYSDANYSDDVYIEPDPGDTDVGNPNVVPAGPTPVATVDYVGGQPRIKITFTGVDWPFVFGYPVQAGFLEPIYNVTLSNEGAGEPHVTYTGTVEPGSYIVRVWIQSITGARSKVPGSVVINVEANTTPPGDVPWSTFAVDEGLVSGEWGAATVTSSPIAGYTVKRIPNADYTGTSADWTHANAVTVASQLNALSHLWPAQPSGTYWYCVKAVDTDGNESTNAICKKLVIATDAWTSSSSDVSTATLTNMHQYTIDGDSAYVVTSTGQTWAQRFGDTSPLATWSDVLQVATTYAPDMMLYDGSTGYYNKSFTSSGNKVAGVLRFNRSSFTGGGFECLLAERGPTSKYRIGCYAYSSDYADSDRQNKISIQTHNSAGANICLLFTPSGYLDGSEHIMFYEFDGDTGAATFIIGGVDADDTGNADRVAPTTGTLDSGASSTLRVGSDGTYYFGGRLGFCGTADAGGLSWNDFMDTYGNPKQIDEGTASPAWTEWGAQPLFWNADGDMENNAGSAGNMTKNGTITAVEYDVLPAERWGGDLATDSAFESDVWDTGSMRAGNFSFSDGEITLYGGTQSDVISLGDNSSPIAFTDYSSTSKVATARHVKVKVSTSDSPASAGDGLHIKLPIPVTFNPATLTQSGSVTIADDSPIANPQAVTFTTAYSVAPTVNASVVGSTALIAQPANITTTGFDMYLFDTSGNLVAGTVNWTASGA